MTDLHTGAIYGRAENAIEVRIRSAHLFWQLGLMLKLHGEASSWRSC